MSQKIPNPTESVVFLIEHGKGLEEAIKIVTRNAAELGVRHQIPSADEVRAFIWRHQMVLQNATYHAMVSGSTGPLCTLQPPKGHQPSPVALIAMAVLDARKCLN